VPLALRQSAEADYLSSSRPCLDCTRKPQPLAVAPLVLWFALMQAVPEACCTDAAGRMLQAATAVLPVATLGDPFEARPSSAQAFS